MMDEFRLKIFTSFFLENMHLLKIAKTNRNSLCVAYKIGNDQNLQRTIAVVVIKV